MPCTVWLQLVMKCSRLQPFGEVQIQVGSSDSNCNHLLPSLMNSLLTLFNSDMPDFATKLEVTILDKNIEAVEDAVLGSVRYTNVHMEVHLQTLFIKNWFALCEEKSSCRSVAQFDWRRRQKSLW